MTLNTTIRYLSTLWFAVIVSVALSVLSEKYGPLLEGHYFPVVSVAHIVKIEEVTPNITRVWLASEKLRKCRYKDMQWWFGEKPPGASIKVAATLETGSITRPFIRPIGDLVVGPWLVSMTKAQLEAQSFAYVTHDCHVLWDTKSLFYDSENE